MDDPKDMNLYFNKMAYKKYNYKELNKNYMIFQNPKPQLTQAQRHLLKQQQENNHNKYSNTNNNTIEEKVYFQGRFQKNLLKQH